MYSDALEKLIKALQCLPGVGHKSAQRMAFHLLEKNRKGATLLAETLVNASTLVANCQRCATLTEAKICKICSNEKRDSGLLCVVESPANILAIEATGIYQGLYFVLKGHLSPIDGIGPKDIGIPELTARLAEDNIKEVILATNATVESEATSHYIAELAKDKGIISSRIAYGIPVGSELEYIDGNTIARALASRATIS